MGSIINDITLSQTAVKDIVGMSFPIAVITGFYIIAIFSRKRTNVWQGRLFGFILIAAYILYIYFMVF